MESLQHHGSSVALPIGGALLLLAAPAFAQDPGFQPRMGEPLRGLSAQERDAFEAGLAEFDNVLTVGDGLGPIMNDVGCGVCHNQPAPGGFSTRTVMRFGKAATGAQPFDPLTALGGSLLQVQTIQIGCEEVVPVEADVTAERLTPHIFGAGLLQSIADADIIANETAQAGGLGGTARMVQPVEGGPLRPGRFGWKGGVATVLTFSADAALNEMGLTSSFFPTENAPNGDLVLLAACDTVADPEDVPDMNGVRRIDRFTDFQAFTAPPPQTPKFGTAGEPLFNMIGCADCHLDTAYTTSAVGSPALSGVAIRPYSDFLLHDMGALGDGIRDGVASETQMMTRALWGMQSRISLLHDGRSTGGTFAENVRAAIDEHGGDAAPSRGNFTALSVAEQDAVIAFLGTLGQAEFDFESDNDVDFIDWFFLQPSLTAPVPSFTPDAEEAVADVDQDGDFDLRDFAILQRAFTGQL